MCLAGFTGDGTSCAVFLSVVCRPEMLGIMACFGPEEQLCAWLVLLVTVHLALCSFQSFAGRRCSASWPVWTRRTVMCLAGFTGDGTSCTVFFSVVCRPEMLGIMASLDQKDSYVLGWFYW